MSNKLALAVIMCLLTLLASGCPNGNERSAGDGSSASATQAASPEPLKITINSWIGWAPLYLAKEKGLNGNSQIEILRVEDTGARKTTMISGEVDGYASSVDNFALDAAQGVPGKIVLCFDESFGGDGIVAKKSIGSVAELKGRKVGYQKGLPSHFLLLTALKDAGLQPDAVEQVDMDADKAGAAFVGGHLDAAVTWEPWISNAAETADGKILVTTKDYPGLIVDTLVFREEIISGRKADVANIVNGWFKALEYWEQHKQEADQIMALAYGLEVAEFEAMCSGVRFYDEQRNGDYMGAGADAEIFEVFDSAGELWLSAGVIDAPVAAADNIDASFIGAD